MRLVDLLQPERAVVPLEARTLMDAAFLLLDTMVSSGVSTEPLNDLIGETLPRGGLTVGQQAFLLHFRTDRAGDVAAAIGVAREPVQREEDSNKQGRIVVLIVAPHRESSMFLQAVSAFANALGNDAVVESLLSAESAAQVMDIQQLNDTKLRGYLTVRDLMNRKILSTRPDATLADAARIMITNGVTEVPVVSDTNEVVGLVTHREIMQVTLPRYLKRIKSAQYVAARWRLAGGGGGIDQSDPRSIKVADMMNRSVLCVSEDQALADVANAMIAKDVERFPVTRDGILVGSLTRSEVVRRLLGP